MQTQFITGAVRSRLFIFFLCLVAFSAGAQFVASKTSNGWGSMLVMWSPGLAAIVAAIVKPRPFREFGLRPGRPKYLAIGWALPVACAGVIYGIAWLSGLESMPSAVFLKRAAWTLHLHPATPPTQVVMRAFGYLSIMGLLNIGALGEELGWRGFLFPELNRVLGFHRAALFSGAIWAVWHWPLLLCGGYNAGTPMLYALPCLTVMTISTGITSGWLRMRSGSIWPCFVMHSVHNAMIQKFFDRISVDHGYGKYFTGEFGIGLALASMAVACWFWRNAADQSQASLATGASSWRTQQASVGSPEACQPA
jgi:uncharacterized protein